MLTALHLNSDGELFVIFFGACSAVGGDTDSRLQFESIIDSMSRTTTPFPRREEGKVEFVLILKKGSPRFFKVFRKFLRLLIYCPFQMRLRHHNLKLSSIK